MPKRKLTWQAACEIRERRDATAKKLAAEYGVSPYTIRAIRADRAYTRPPKQQRRPARRDGIHACPDCGRTPDETIFAADNSKPHGFCSYCKDCQGARNARWYAANRERKQAWQRSYSRKAAFIPIAEAAQILGVATQTVWGWQHAGYLPSTALDSRRLGIPREAVERLKARLQGRKLTDQVLAALAADMLTPRQCAAALGVSRQRVYQLIAAGRLPAERHAAGYLIHPAALAEFQHRRRER